MKLGSKIVLLIGVFIPCFAQAQNLTKEVYKTHSDGSPEIVYYYQGEQRAANKVKMEQFGQYGDKIKEEHYQNKVLHGKQREWNVISEGKNRISKEYNYAKGRLDGLQKDWFYDGSIKNELNYINGVLHGKQVSRFAKDQIHFELYYANGKPNGLQKEWTQKRTKKYELKFDSGKLDGFQRWWHYDGSVIEEDWDSGILTIESIKNGQKLLSKYSFILDRTSISLDPNYKSLTDYRKLIKQIYLFSEGKPAEEQLFSPQYHYKSWYKNGKLKVEGSGKVTDKKGIWVEYHPNGQKSAKGMYDRSRKMGQWNTWNDRGWLKSEEEYDYNGIRKKKIYSYYTNGKKESEGDLRVSYSLRYGDKDGSWKYWFPNGELKREEVYKPGPYSGNRPFIKTFTEWYVDGKVKLKGTDGKAVRYYYDSTENKVAEMHLIYQKSRGLHEYYNNEGKLTINPNYEKKRGGGTVLGYTFQEGYPAQLDEYYLNGNRKASFLFCRRCFIPPNPLATNMNEYNKLKLPPAGTLDGIQQGWYENGNMRYSYTFQEGCLSGEQKEWRLDSTPLYTLLYRKRAYLNKVDTSNKCQTHCAQGIYYNAKAKRLDYVHEWDQKTLVAAKQSGDYSQLRSIEKGKSIKRVEAEGYLSEFLERIRNS